MLSIFAIAVLVHGISAQFQPGINQFGGQLGGQFGGQLGGQLGGQFPNQFGQPGLGFQNQINGQILPGQLGAQGIPGQAGFNTVNTFQNQQFLQQNVGNPNSCHVRGCGIGQQCVYRSNFGIPYICPTWIPVLPCQCVPGCKAQNQFIQVGETKQIDTCGNRCTCNTQNGQASCTQIACNQASPGTQPQTIGAVPGVVPGAFPGGVGGVPGAFPGGIQGGIPGAIPGALPGGMAGGVPVGAPPVPQGKKK